MEDMCMQILKVKAAVALLTFTFVCKQKSWLPFKILRSFGESLQWIDAERFFNEKIPLEETGNMLEINVCKRITELVEQLSTSGKDVVDKKVFRELATNAG